MSYFFLIIFVLVLIWIFVQRKLSGVNVSSYSWIEILNPFNSAPLLIYKHLSPENKGSFWSVAASVLIAVITCWLGFSLQYFVYNSAQSESEKLAHYETIDKFRPKFVEIYDSCSMNVMEKMVMSLGYSTSKHTKLSSEDYQYYIKNKQFPDNKKNTPNAQLASYILDKRNWEPILYTANKIVHVSSEIAPYLDDKSSSKLLNNNSSIIVSSQIFELSNKNDVLDSVKIVDSCIKKQVKASVLQLVSYRTNWSKISSHQYSLFKELRDNNSLNKEMVLSLLLLQGVLLPMFENMITIQSSFCPSSNSNSILIASLLILLISLFLGYYILRILAMKFFDKRSMTPNPRMSQSDYQKIIHKISNAEKELGQHKINEITLLNTIQTLKKNLEKKEEEVEKKKNGDE